MYYINNLNNAHTTKITFFSKVMKFFHQLTNKESLRIDSVYFVRILYLNYEMTNFCINNLIRRDV